MSTFDKALDFTLRWEGGYVNDPDDPGGETKFGISKRAYPDVNIKELTRETAGQLYYRDYWLATHCDNLSPEYACAVFDTAVNCGVSRALKWFDDSNNWRFFLKHRKNHYESLVEKKPLMSKYLKGWLNRLTSLISFCHKIEQETKQ